MLSVVIPCYNEEAVFEELLKRLVNVIPGVSTSYEIIFVDDGSSDCTWEKILTASKSNIQVRGIRFSSNRGHQIALTAGLQAAQGDRIFMLDADLQDPPELLNEMMAELDNGNDVAFGRRLERYGESRFKRLTAFAFYRILNSLSDTVIPVDTGDFRLVTRRVLDAVLSMPEQSRFIRGMFAWVGFKQVGVDYIRQERVAGETKYPFQSMFKLALDAFTGFSVAPLKLATKLSYVSLIITFCSGLYVLFSLVSVQVVPGWASILLALSFLSGVQLFTLGIIGEYVGRIYVEVKKRPLYFVSQDTRENDNA